MCAPVRLLLPGPDPVGWASPLIGLGGSFIAGLFAWYVSHRRGGGLVLSVLFSMLLVWAFRTARAIPAAAAAAADHAPQRVLAGAPGAGF